LNVLSGSFYAGVYTSAKKEVGERRFAVSNPLHPLFRLKPNS